MISDALRPGSRSACTEVGWHVEHLDEVTIRARHRRPSRGCTPAAPPRRWRLIHPQAIGFPSTSGVCGRPQTDENPSSAAGPRAVTSCDQPVAGGDIGMYAGNDRTASPELRAVADLNYEITTARVHNTARRRDRPRRGVRPRAPRGTHRRRTSRRARDEGWWSFVNEAAIVASRSSIFGWAILSEWLAARNVTGPLVFLVAGLLLANPRLGGRDRRPRELRGPPRSPSSRSPCCCSPTPRRSRSAAARHDLPLTARLLGIGLPLSILAGTGVAVLVFPSLPLALAGLIAASLAPTDAALSASVIADERLPVGVRRVLNVESGLNDGIATPVVTFCIAAAAAALGIVGARLRRRVRRARRAAVGARRRRRRRASSAVGSLALAHRRGWMQHGARRLGDAGAGAVSPSWSPSEVGGNPFVAAFVGGLVFGAAARERRSGVGRAHRAGRQPAVARAVVRLRGRRSCSPPSRTSTAASVVYAVPA